MRAGAEMVFACSDTLNAKHVSNGLLVLHARSIPLLASRLVLSSLAFRMPTIYEIIVFIFVCSLFGWNPETLWHVGRPLAQGSSVWSSVFPTVDDVSMHIRKEDRGWE